MRNNTIFLNFDLEYYFYRNQLAGNVLFRPLLKVIREKFLHSVLILLWYTQHETHIMKALWVPQQFLRFQRGQLGTKTEVRSDALVYTIVHMGDEKIINYFSTFSKKIIEK